MDLLVRDLRGESSAKVTAVCHLPSHRLKDRNRSIVGGLGAADHDCQRAFLGTDNTWEIVSFIDHANVEVLGRHAYLLRLERPPGLHRLLSIAARPPC